MNTSRINNVLKTSFLLSVLLLGCRLAQADQVLLEDHFNRPDSPSLGAPWTEQNERTSEFTAPNGDLIGPGFIELNNGALGFHYTTHSQRFSNFFHSGNGQPDTFAPLSSPVTSFPITVSYTFTPHQDERTTVVVGLMSAGHGFFKTQHYPPNVDLDYHNLPNFGLAIAVGRSSLAFNNSSMQVLEYDNGNQSTLGSGNLPFQLESGNTYSVRFTIAQDFSTTLQVSDGISTSSLSTGSTSFTTPFSLDQIFLSSVQGGVSFDTFALGDFVLRFDDVLVTQAGLTVQIDIKPGSLPNCFNLNGNGVIPVAILGSADFDVIDINTASLSFAGLRVRLRGNNNPSCATEYSNNDQFLDMICQFEDDPASWRGGSDTAELSGNLIDGTAFKGTDSICIVP